MKSPAAAALAADPAWLPHRIDLAERRVMFLRIARAQVVEHGFLAEREGAAESAWMPLDQYAALASHSAPAHFVFHTGFCRSTLLIRALDIPGTSVGLNEPGILNSLVKAGSAAAVLVQPTIALLARRHAPDEAVIVKPSNYANGLIGPILRAGPQSRAILMTDPLATFLARVARKGLIGRLWGRQVFLEAQTHSGSGLGIDMRAVAAMTDLQAAGLGWFLNQRIFAGLLDGSEKARLRSLLGERLNQAPAEALFALARFFGLDLAPAEARAIAEGPAFRLHAKLGGDFAAVEAASVRHGASPATDDEIAEVDTWIASLAQQAGIAHPPRQTLF
jgi:hypothetical protein